MNYRIQKYILMTCLTAALCVSLSMVAQNPGDGPACPELKCRPEPAPSAEQPEARSAKEKRQGRIPDSVGKKIPKMFFSDDLSEADKAELSKLAKENPEAFRKELMKRFRAAREKDFHEMMLLRKQYLEAPTPEQKLEARKEIEARIKRQTMRQLDMTQRRIVETENQLNQALKKLEEFREDHKKRMANMDKMVETMVQKFTDPNHQPQLPQFGPNQKRNQEKDAPAQRRPAPDGLGPMPPPPPHEPGVTVAP